MKAFFKDSALWTLLAIVFVVNGLAMPKETYPGDPLAMREESRAILEGHLNVPPEIATKFGDPGQFFVKNIRSGDYYSKYGLMNSVFFVPPLWLEKIFEGDVKALDAPSRTFYLNLNNWVWSLILAFFLYALASLYTTHKALRVAYVLLCFYATFQWSYLRAQSSEIFQLTLFAALSWLVLSAKHAGSKKSLSPPWFAMGWALIWMLTGIRVVYVLLVPIYLWACLDLLRSPNESWSEVALRVLRKNLMWGILFGLLVGTVNFVKFGSPLLTGYHQWRPEIHALNGDWTESLYGLLFSAQWSLLIHFPLVLVAIWGYATFVRKWAFDATWSLSILGVFYVVVGKLPSWRGEACYGPRYFLFIMPVLCLAALPLMESWLREPRKCSSRVALGVGALVLGYSLFLQEQVNRRTFLAFYKLRDPVAQHMTQLTAWYYDGSHYGRVNWDFVRADGNMEPFEFWQQLKKVTAPEPLEGYRKHIQQVLSTTNYYWF